MNVWLKAGIYVVILYVITRAFWGGTSAFQWLLPFPEARLHRRG